MKKFEDAIRTYLDQRAVNDPQFATAYAKENKSIEECCRYIIGEAHKQQENGRAVISDEEVYGMAVHYYDEDDIKIEEVHGGAVCHNAATYEPTDEEKQQARERALQLLEEEQYQTAKKEKKRQEKEKQDEEKRKIEEAQKRQMSLLNLL